jgi:hypothetical protein
LTERERGEREGVMVGKERSGKKSV